MLGGVATATFISSTSPGSVASVSLTNGIWILFGGLYFPNTTYKEISISSGVSCGFDPNSQITSSATGTGALSISRSVSITTGPTTWYLQTNNTPSVTVQNISFYAVRLG